jgi:predicted amidohydrolase
MSWITIAAVQPPCPDERSAAENARVIRAGLGYLEVALAKGTAFVCLPEFFNVFGMAEMAMRDAAANATELLARVSELAGHHGGHVVLPLLVREGDHCRNRAYLIGPRGEVIGAYDKTHPTLGEREQLGIVAGDDIPVFETEHGRVAVVICYDVYFSELFAVLARGNPDVIFFPSLQRSDHEMANEALLKTRAMDSQAYIVRSSYGRPSELPWRAGLMFGQSCVVHPDGTLLANAGHYEGLALAYVQCPFNWQRQRCGGYPSMSVREFLREDRRPELY